jgi:hypothetical protein
MTIARELLRKHTSKAMNMHATLDKMLEAMFSVRSVLRLHNEGKWDKSRSGETAASQQGCEQ